MARRLGEECYEVPVGFKHIVSSMQKHNALLGGESSGGLTIRGHILGKDGIFASALVVEMLARTGKRIGALREDVFGITGRLFNLEEALPATPEMRVAVPRHLADATLRHVGSYPIERISRLDGTKIYLDDDTWLLIRFSGTEPVLRLVVEADSVAKAQELMAWFKAFVGSVGKRAAAAVQPELRK
jgi:phosphomannomutase